MEEAAFTVPAILWAGTDTSGTPGRRQEEGALNCTVAAPATATAAAAAVGAADATGVAAAAAAAAAESVLVPEVVETCPPALPSPPGILVAAGVHDEAPISFSSPSEPWISLARRQNASFSSSSLGLAVVAGVHLLVVLLEKKRLTVMGFGGSATHGGLEIGASMSLHPFFLIWDFPSAAGGVACVEVKDLVVDPRRSDRSTCDVHFCRQATPRSVPRSVPTK